MKFHPKISRNDIAYTELALSLLIFLYITSFFPVFQISGAERIVYAAETAVFILMVVLHVESKAKGLKKRPLLISNAFFMLFLMLFALNFLLSGRLMMVLLAGSLPFFFYLAAYTFMFLPLVFLTTFGIYLIKLGKRREGLMLLAMALIFMSFYYLHNVIKYLKPSDETVLAYESANSLMHGTNPYTTSQLPILLKYHAEHSLGLTITANNTIISVMDYPALYFLSVLPFYLIERGAASDFARINATLQGESFIYGYLFLVAVAILLAKGKKIPKFNAFIMILVGLVIQYAAATQVYLMVALLLLSYIYMDKKYAFVFLGLALALQEEAWFSVLLLVVYSINNKGFKRGIYDALGAAAVFLILNSYFMLSNPSAYIAAVFMPLQKALFPSALASFGYPLAVSYHASLALFSHLFMLAVLILTLVFAYANRKEYIFAFSFTPYYFMSHTTPYIFTFAILLLLVLSTDETQRRSHGVLEGYFKNNKAVFCALLAISLIAAAAMIYGNHLSYEKSFNLSIANQSAHISGNSLFYNGTLHYGNLSSNTVYFMMLAFSKYSLFYYGFYNSSIINVSRNCGAYCVNPNRIILNRSSGSYRVSAELNISIYSDINPCAEAFVYTDKYFYAAESVYCDAPGSSG